MSEKEVRLPPVPRPRLHNTISNSSSVSGLTSLSRRETSHNRPPSPDYTPGLIFVRYGASKMMVLNTFCQTLHLLNFMKQLSGCSSIERVDLMSWKSGELQNISRLKFDYAYRFLKCRETYLLVKVTQTIDSNRRLPRYRSLLDNLDKLNPDLSDKLEQLSKPAKSLSLKNKWTSLSKKGAESTDKNDRKSGLTSILAAQTNPASGIIGIIAAVQQVTSDSSGSNIIKRKQSPAENLLKRVIKLPPLLN